VEAPAELGPGDGRGGRRRHKGALIQAYTQPVPERRVIGLEELGPGSAQTSPGEVWMGGPGRATFAPDDGRRGRGGWGVFEPATGLATMRCRPRRDSASFMRLLEQVVQTSPAQGWVLITDHLSTHRSRETHTALIAWPEVPLVFIPTSACWRHLMEPWWKQRRSLALRGRRFEDGDELIEAVGQGPAYWHQHRYPSIWKKAL
jgi:DDE superfamily endonuclease